MHNIAKVVVIFERRDDGGLRAYSDDVPGFVLSHKDPASVIRDIEPALARILSAMWGVSITPWNTATAITWIPK